MFDPPFDAPPVIVALTLAAATTFGIATALAPVPPADAADLAAVVDRVATSPIPTMDTHATTADAVRIDPGRLSTRDASGVHHATFTTGHITPVTPDTRLAEVLHGASPDAVFHTPVDLETAARYARENTPGWQHDPATIRVRYVTWGAVNVTLVGV